MDVQQILENERIIREKKEKEEKLRFFREEEKRRAAEEKLKEGEKGKGEKGDYLRICKLCWVQYKIDIEICTHCGKETSTKEVIYYSPRPDIEN